MQLLSKAKFLGARICLNDLASDVLFSENPMALLFS